MDLTPRQLDLAQRDRTWVMECELMSFQWDVYLPFCFSMMTNVQFIRQTQPNVMLAPQLPITKVWWHYLWWTFFNAGDVFWPMIYEHYKLRFINRVCMIACVHVVYILLRIVLLFKMSLMYHNCCQRYYGPNSSLSCTYCFDAWSSTRCFVMIRVLQSCSSCFYEVI